MKRWHFFFLLALLCPFLAVADDATPDAQQANSISVTQVMQKISELRRLVHNGWLPELEASGRLTGLTETQKDQFLRALIVSQPLNELAEKKLRTVLALLQCIKRGTPSVITPACSKNGLALLNYADQLLAKESSTVDEIRRQLE